MYGVPYLDIYYSIPFYSREATRQVAMLAWISGDCCGVFDCTTLNFKPSIIRYIGALRINGGYSEKLYVGLYSREATGTADMLTGTFGGCRG